MRPSDGTEIAASTRSPEGGWSGQGMPQEGDFVRPRPAGNVHIANVVSPRGYVAVACGKGWWSSVLDPASGDHGRQCQPCWEAL